MTQQFCQAGRKAVSSLLAAADHTRLDFNAQSMTRVNMTCCWPAHSGHKAILLRGRRCFLPDTQKQPGALHLPGITAELCGSRIAVSHTGCS